MTTLTTRPPLERHRAAVLGGVSTGLALHLGWDVQRTRLVFVGLALAGGAGILLYAWLWAFVPLEEAPDDAPPPTRSAPVAVITVALAAAATTVVLVTAREDFVIGWLLAVLALCGAAVAWTLAFDRTDPARSRLQGLRIRVIAVALLLVAGSVALASRPTALAAVVAVAMLVSAVGVVVAPFVVQLWTDLMTQRAARVRELQRAEIAAHLHDSVLQTLALIQNRADPASEVARIARAQERELRDWLFAGDAPPVDDLAAELSTLAASIELDYAVRIDVVSTGSFITGHPSVVAAAREAMLNAAKHAGGTVSVYVEGSAGAVDVFVRDRGAGFSLDDLPGDRLGVKESIIGRMERAGGHATVRSLGPGTEVHLHWELA